MYKQRKMKWFKLIWLLITSKKFRYQFQDIYDYAILNYKDKRGQNASNVLIFVHDGWDKKLTKHVDVLEWHEKLKKKDQKSI